MPFTVVDGHDGQIAKRISFVQLRDALAHHQYASILVMSTDGGEVNLVPLQQALQEQPDGLLMVFGAARSPDTPT